MNVGEASAKSPITGSNATQRDDLLLKLRRSNADGIALRNKAFVAAEARDRENSPMKTPQSILQLHKQSSSPHSQLSHAFGRRADVELLNSAFNLNAVATNNQNASTIQDSSQERERGQEQTQLARRISMLRGLRENRESMSEQDNSQLPQKENLRIK